MLPYRLRARCNPRTFFYGAHLHTTLHTRCRADMVSGLERIYQRRSALILHYLHRSPNSTCTLFFLLDVLYLLVERGRTRGVLPTPHYTGRARGPHTPRTDRVNSDILLWTSNSLRIPLRMPSVFTHTVCVDFASRLSTCYWLCRTAPGFERLAVILWDLPWTRYYRHLPPDGWIIGYPPTNALPGAAPLTRLQHHYRYSLRTTGSVIYLHRHRCYGGLPRFIG